MPLVCDKSSVVVVLLNVTDDHKVASMFAFGEPRPVAKS
jgi:hypothetical protein